MGFQSQNFNDFFTKGFVVGEFKHNIKEFYYYDFPNCEDPNIGEEAGVPTQAENSLKFLQDQIAINIISKVFTSFEYKNFGMWEGVDDGSSEWHNDWEDGKNMNTNVLVYLDDAKKHNNSIEVRDKNSKNVILPMAGDFVWLNQGKGFQHRARHNGGRRRVLSFEYFVEGIK
jgi:hypothetical protein